MIPGRFSLTEFPEGGNGTKIEYLAVEKSTEERKCSLGKGSPGFKSCLHHFLNQD